MKKEKMFITILYGSEDMEMDKSEIVEEYEIETDKDSNTVCDKELRKAKKKLWIRVLS